MRSPLVLVASALVLSACDRSEPAPPADQTSAPTSAPVERAETTHPAAPQETRRQCFLSVDGVTHLDGPCLVYSMGPRDYTLNTWSEGKPGRSHFAVVTETRDGVADATWNADPDDRRAGDPLGEVALKDGCWVNARTRICAGGPA